MAEMANRDMQERERERERNAQLFTGVHGSKCAINTGRTYEAEKTVTQFTVTSFATHTLCAAIDLLSLSLSLCVCVCACVSLIYCAAVRAKRSVHGAMFILRQKVQNFIKGLTQSKADFLCTEQPNGLFLINH